VSQAEGIEGDARPLTRQEYELVQRLLSDPFSFPLAYKSWLVSYMETSDLSLPMASILGLKKALNPPAVTVFAASHTSAAGLILLSARQALPDGVLLCDGATYPKDDYPELWDAIGGTWGEPTAGSFNVPTLPDPASGIHYVIVS
jgi:Phage Tail Collar Domain